MDNNYNQTDSIQKRFSTILIEKREEKGLSQTELAQKLYVTRQAVSKWETGKAVPDAYMLLKIADILDCSVSDLIADKQPLSSNTQPINSTEVEPSLVADVQPLVSASHQPSAPPPKKHAKFKRIAPVWAAVLAFTIIASTLMGVYIPKATHAQTQPEPKPITYVNANVMYQGSDYDPNIIINNDRCLYRYRGAEISPTTKKSYWKFVPDFNSTYCLSFVTAQTVYDPKLLINGVEYSYYREGYDSWILAQMYMLANNEYIIELDYSCAEQDYNYVFTPSLGIIMHGDFSTDNPDVISRHGFENVTIPANSEYTVMLDPASLSCINFKILNKNVTFTKIQRQLKMGYDREIIYDEELCYYSTGVVYNDGSELALRALDSYYNDDHMTYQNRYYWVTIANDNDYAIDLNIESRGNYMLNLEFIEGYCIWEIQIPEVGDCALIRLLPHSGNFQILSPSLQFLNDAIFDVYIIIQDENGNYIKKYIDYTFDENGNKCYSTNADECYLQVYENTKLILNRI